MVWYDMINMTIEGFNSVTVGSRVKSNYRKISNIRRTKFLNVNISRLVLELCLLNPMKPGVKSRMEL